MPPWTERTFGRWRWWVDPGWCDRLLDEHGLRLEEWRSAGLVEPIKQARHRTVFRVRLGGTAIFIKHYPIYDLRAWLRQLVRPTKARTECAMARELAARGVPTLEPLAFAEGAWGESWLVTRELEDCVPLNVFVERDTPTLSPDVRHPLRLRLAKELARFLARMHQAGVTHPDLHAGNILIHSQEPLALYLIDLHGVRLGAPLDWPAARDNLVMLNRWFVQRSSRTDRRRFWRAYVQCHTGAAEDPTERDRARDLEHRTWESCLAFWRGRDRRCLGTNRYFYRLTEGANRAIAVRDLPQDTLRRWLHDPDALFAAPGSRVVKHSRSSTVAELSPEASGLAKPVIYKRFTVTKWSDPWVGLVRHTPALRSWINGHRLLESGVPTPRPLAVLHRHRSGLPRECYLITEKAPDALELHRCVADLSRRPPPERTAMLRALIEAVARLVRSLHDRQLSHRDLKAANVLVTWASRSAGDPRVRLHLIDLVGLQRFRRLGRSPRIQNLARLHTSFVHDRLITRTEKLRFLRVYLAWGLKGQAGWKEWWRAIARATEEKVAQNVRRGRPLS